MADDDDVNGRQNCLLLSLIQINMVFLAFNCSVMLFIYDMLPLECSECVYSVLSCYFVRCLLSFILEV